MSKQVKRGLSLLLANIEDETKFRGTSAPSHASHEGGFSFDVPADENYDVIINASVTEVVSDPNQPRKLFREDTIKELAESIRTHGILQPLIVKRHEGKYMIIAGERRFRAANMAGLKEVPVIVRELSDMKAREISLIENLQREDLNAIEESEALRELMTTYKLTQEDIAAKLGKARPSIANTLRLLNLSREVQELVRNDTLSAGHARALLAIAVKQDQIDMAKKAIEEGWSVRQLEKEVRYYVNPETRPVKIAEKVREKLTQDMKAFVNDFSKAFAVKVKLIGNETKGRIVVDYENNDQLLHIYQQIKKLEK